MGHKMQPTERDYKVLAGISVMLREDIIILKDIVLGAADAGVLNRMGSARAIELTGLIVGSGIKAEMDRR